MTSPQPRRTRRRAVPGPTLPRPGSVAAAAGGGTGRAAPRGISSHRTHHVTTDYSYIHRDLIAAAAVGAVVPAFIVGMSFLV